MCGAGAGTRRVMRPGAGRARFELGAGRDNKFFVRVTECLCAGNGMLKNFMHAKVT